MFENKWIFYVADAYYLLAEIVDSNHPMNQLAAIRTSTMV
jgi:hypothetical protein